MIIVKTPFRISFAGRGNDKILKKSLLTDSGRSINIWVFGILKK